MNTDISSRQHSIMEYIREHGSVQVETLARHLNVTPQTIRRDLNQLYDLKLVQRVHGGAVIKDNVENLGYGARKALMTREKSDIARRAAELIPDNSSLFLAIGTTTERVAEHLKQRQGMLVITNNMNVGNMLWPSRGLEVLIAGGMIRQADGGIVGSSAEEFISRFKVDYAVIGCSAIDPDGELLDYDLREVRVMQTIIRRARAVILVADSMKFERFAPIQIADISDIDILVTDSGISKKAQQLCRSKNIRLEIAGQAESSPPGEDSAYDDRTA